MKLIIHNHAKLPNKYIRYVRYKLRNLKSKFRHVIYTEVFIKREGDDDTGVYKTTFRIGVAGKDIVLNKEGRDLKFLWKQSFRSFKRNLSRSKERQIAH